MFICQLLWRRSTQGCCVLGRQAQSGDSVPDVWAILSCGVGQIGAEGLRGISPPGCPHGDNRNAYVPPQTHKRGGDSLQLHAWWEWANFTSIYVSNFHFWDNLHMCLSVIYVDGSQSTSLRRYLYTMLEGSDPNQGRYAITLLEPILRYLGPFCVL